MKRKLITEKQAIKLVKRFGVIFDKSELDKIPHGGFLFKKLNTETGEEIFYFLRRYFVQKYNKKYSCKKGGDVGRELLMSNLPMPNINKFLR